MKSLISISRDPCRIVGLRFHFPEAGSQENRGGGGPGTALRHRADSGSRVHAGEISMGMPCGQSVGDSFGMLVYVVAMEVFVRGSRGGADVGLTQREQLATPKISRIRNHHTAQGDGTSRRAPGLGHSAERLDEPAAPSDEMHARASPSQPPRMRGQDAVVGGRLLGSSSGGGLWRSPPCLTFHCAAMTNRLP